MPIPEQDGQTMAVLCKDITANSAIVGRGRRMSSSQLLTVAITSFKNTRQRQAKKRQRTRDEMLRTASLHELKEGVKEGGRVCLQTVACRAS